MPFLYMITQSSLSKESLVEEDNTLAWLLSQSGLSALQHPTWLGTPSDEAKHDAFWQLRVRLKILFTKRLCKKNVLRLLIFFSLSTCCIKKNNNNNFFLCLKKYFLNNNNNKIL